MQTSYSRRSPAVKRLMKEAQELKEPTEQYFAQPLEDNLFEWHFTVRGPPDTDFGGGVYHGRITLPPEYPMKPPSIMLLTPTGRFEVGTKICLSISGHHPETWQPSWSIRTVLLAIIGFMPTKGEGAIGSLDYKPDERKILARKSQEWKCQICGTPNKSVLPAVTTKSADVQKEAAKLAVQINFKREEKKPQEKVNANKPEHPAVPANNPLPAPLRPNPFNMWNQQAGMVPNQPPFMPFPQNFLRPGQFELGNQNPQLPANQPHVSLPQNVTDQQGQMPLNIKKAGKSEDQPSRTSESGPSQPSSQAASLGDNVPIAGVRQRTSAATRTNLTHATNQRTTPPRAPLTRDQGAQGLLCPLLIMSIFSFLIIILILRRLYVMYEYKFT